MLKDARRFALLPILIPAIALAAGLPAPLWLTVRA